MVGSSGWLVDKTGRLSWARGRKGKGAAEVWGGVYSEERGGSQVGLRVLEQLAFSASL